MTDATSSKTLLLPEWTAELGTRAGTRLRVRPAAPEDAPALKQFFARLTPSDLRFRFLSALPRPGESVLDMLVAVDHVRTEDYLAFADVDGRSELVASAMLAADAAMDRAEVAIAVRPDFRAHGLGWTLLDFVAREAAAKGIRSLESIECRGNVAAISLEREMGFTVTDYPGDATLALVRKTLSAR